MRSCLVAPALLVVALVSCKDRSSGAAAAGSASSSGAPAAPSSSVASPASSTTSATPGTAKGPTTKLTGQQLKDAYAAVLAGDDPFDTELATVKSKLGEPQKVEGDTSLWWGWSPKEGEIDPTCYELSMSPTGGSSVGGTEWNRCGMAE